MLHIIRSLKSKGKGAIILPHGVLFRGAAEAEIRTNIIRRGYIKGIIGLPPNLFYGTGIPACIIILDKENAESRKGIFMIDASKGFMKGGPKNRLREQDIHKIVDTFNKQLEIEKYSRMVPVTEIEANEFNLNIPRYIDSQEAEDIQDIEAHLLGDIPNADIDVLHPYWEVYPTLRKTLFATGSRANSSKLLIPPDTVKPAIFSHTEFVDYSNKVNTVFSQWKSRNVPKLKNIAVGDKPKKLIHNISEDLLQAFSNLRLIDKYDVYQHLMVYWSETIQDDVYALVDDGWEAGKDVEKLKKKKEWEGHLIPKTLIIARYFEAEQKAIEDLEVDCEVIADKREEMEEEHSGEEGVLEPLKNGKGKITKGNVEERVLNLKNDILNSTDITEEQRKLAKAIKKDLTKTKWIKGIKDEADFFSELDVLYDYLILVDEEKEAKRKIKEAQSKLDKKVLDKYKTLTKAEMKALVVEDKWMAALEGDVKTEMDRISQRLTGRIKELAERYATPAPVLTAEVEALEQKVQAHLKNMGFEWN